MKIPRDVPLTGRPAFWVMIVLGTGLLTFFLLVKKQAASDPELLWREAEADFLARHYDRAETKLARLARLREPTPLDRLLRAQVGMIRNRPEEVLADLAAVPDGHAMAPQARLLAGQFELRRRRLRSAETLLRQALKLDPTLVQAHKELIYIYGMLLRRRELNDAFRALGQVAPLTYDNVFHWCLTRNSLWEPKEIVSDLTAFVQADPEDRWSRLALAETLRQLGRLEEAEQVLKPLSETDPEALAVRARIALDRNDEAAVEAILDRGPSDHAELARIRGRLALAKQDVQAALRAFRLAYKSDPDHRDSIAGLGQSLAMTGDTKAAAPYLAAARNHDALGTLMQRAATEAGRSDPALLRALGSACEAIHRIPEARAWYELAIRGNPLDAESQKALFRLKDIAATAPKPSPSRTVE
ncbi:MAG: tetratricopeptide repeat protein [Isosphaeraceae bacterium]